MTTILCTLVIGETRIPEVNKLISTFKQFTDYDIVVYTDQPVENILKAGGVYVIPMSDIGNYPHRIGPCFNFNLKGIVCGYTYNNFLQYDRLVWVDCDVFLTDECKQLDNMVEFDVYVRGGPFPDGFQAYTKYTHIVEYLNIPLRAASELKYINEVLIVINRTEKSTAFINRWFEICVECSKNKDINPCYEAVEFAIALSEHPVSLGDIPRFRALPETPVPVLFTEHRKTSWVHL